MGGMFGKKALQENQLLNGYKGVIALINKKLGNKFEKELSEILYNAGYWVHLLNQNKNGQPADIIAVKNKKAYLIDAKVCSLEKFVFKRVEENQHLSMQMFIDCGNTTPYFTLKARNEIYMLSYKTIRDLMKQGKKQLDFAEINKYGTRLNTWLRIQEVVSNE